MKRLTLSVATLAALASVSSQAATYSGYTPPGTQLSVGQSAIIPTHIPSKGAFPSRITVSAIERGSMDDLRRAGYSIPDTLANSTPYYVRYSMELVDMNGYGASDISGVTLSSTTAIDDRNEARMATIFTPGSALAGAHFDKCAKPAYYGLNPAPGATVSGCQIYMVNSNGSITGWRIQLSAESFNGSDAYWKSPVVWKTTGQAQQAAPADPAKNW